MIRQGSGELDLAEIAADAALLDLLAARTETTSDDPVVRMLAAFAAEVDDGLAELLAPDEVEVAVPAVSVVPALTPVSDGRRHGLRATTVALVVGATLSVSGVAAAVTGDPFAPYRGIVSAVTGGDDEADAQAARMARLHRQLSSTRAKVARGDLAGAGADLSAMRARLAETEGLSHGQRTSLEARIAALEAGLARASVAQQHGKGNGRPAADPTATPGQQGVASPESQDGGIGQSDKPNASQPDSTKVPQPQNTKVPQPDSTKVPQPQNTKVPQPQNTKVPQPQNTKVPQPQNTKKAEPAPTVSPDPQKTQAQPRATRTPSPQNTKTADSALSPTAPPAGTEQPGNGNGGNGNGGNGNGNGGGGNGNGNGGSNA